MALSPYVSNGLWTDGVCGSGGGGHVSGLACLVVALAKLRRLMRWLFASADHAVLPSCHLPTAVCTSDAAFSSVTWWLRPRLSRMTNLSDALLFT